MNKNNVAIVIPSYKSVLNENEVISINQTLKILSEYPIYIVIPNSIDDTFYEQFDNINLKKLNPYFFSSISSYNELLLDPSFYSQFGAYENVLICQLDVFIFRDELKYWCNKEYDYIGGPWINSDFFCSKKVIMTIAVNKPILAIKLLLHNFFGKKNNSTGNGGFSLRNVGNTILALNSTKKTKELWLKYKGNEDIFLSSVVPLLMNSYKIAPWEESLKFSFDKNPDVAFSLNKGQLPFACHGWYNYDPDFWKPIIGTFTMD